ncbi:MAG: hypothetical protein E7L04_03900 [Anaerococcus sp.]|uniref:hypothetical protein n=1 Tax=Anaerococcus sp. TaxID=1872515 RepID=UPI00290D04AF|nr:hypothetical protein [Anaerococcus sp.]MDU7411623.1 hypothetical protein [Anaerococcus sp.]
MKKLSYKKLDKENFINSFIIALTFIFLYTLLNLVNNELFFNIYYDEQLSVTNNIKYILIVSLFVIGSLIIETIIFNSKSKEMDLRALLSLGLKSKDLFFILMKDSLSDLINTILISLPVALFISELLNLLSISFTKLILSEHKFFISLKAILLSLICIIIFIGISNLLITRNLTKSYPLDLVKRNHNTRILTSLFFLITLIYYFKNNYYLNEVLILSIIIFVCIFVGINFIIAHINKIHKNDFLIKALLNDIFSKEKFTMISVIFLIIISSFEFLYGLTQYNKYKINKELRPDFTIFVDSKNINDIYNIKKFSKITNNIYTVNLSSVNKIDDSDFKNLLFYMTDKSDEQILNDPIIMDYSTYKYIFKEDALKLKANEAIYLTSMKNINSNINKYLLKNKRKIYIDNKELLIKGIQNSNVIFANNVITESNIYVINDNLYNKFKKFTNYHAYNIVLNKNYTEKNGYEKVSEKFRKDLEKNNIRFESLIWMIKDTYAKILGSLFMICYLAIISLFTSYSFLGMRLMRVILDNSVGFRIMKDLGASKQKLETDIKDFYFYILRYIFSLIYIIYYGILVSTYISKRIFTSKSIIFILLTIILPIILNVILYIFLKRFLEISITKLE